MDLPAGKEGRKAVGNVGKDTDTLPAEVNSTRILENRFSDMTSAIRYEDGVIAWAAEQAGLLRKGRLDQLDREHLAEEIEDVGKSEQRELVGRMTRFWRTSSSGSSNRDAEAQDGRMPPETPSSPVRAQVAAADLFCGVGGLTLGLRRSGIDVRIGVDIDPACRFPYEHNTGSRFASTDVSTLTANDLVEHLDGADCTLIAGCAPCQPFSSYSRGRATYASGRWGLLREFGRSRSRSRQR